MVDPRKHVGYVWNDKRVLAIGHGEFIKFITLREFFVDGNEDRAIKTIETISKFKDDGMTSYYEGMAMTSNFLGFVNTYSFTNFNTGHGPIYAGLGSEVHHYETLILGCIPKLIIPVVIKNKEIQRVAEGLIMEHKAQITSLRKIFFKPVPDI